MSGIPDEVIEAMLDEGPGDPYLDRWVLGKILVAAEAKGWKLCPKDPTPEMLKEAPLTFEYGDFWDAAPSAKDKA